jgi:hypothetical protein
MIFRNGTRIDEFQHIRADGVAETVAAIRKSHAGSGLAIRLKAAASAVLADSAPTTSDPALALERNAGIDLLKSMKPASGLPGEGIMQKIAREAAANIAAEFTATLKGDDDDGDDAAPALDILKREHRSSPRMIGAAGGIETLASGARAIVRDRRAYIASEIAKAERGEERITVVVRRIYRELGIAPPANL